MRRHCLSRADVAAALWLTQLLLLALRAMLLSALSVSSLFGDSVHCEIRLFELEALQSSERSLPLRMDQVRNCAVTSC
jgi:hypothetical protein